MKRLHFPLCMDSGRQLLGGIDPVKKPGPGEAADPSVAAPSSDPV